MLNDDRYLGIPLESTKGLRGSKEETQEERHARINRRTRRNPNPLGRIEWQCCDDGGYADDATSGRF